jgi:hypothetical protein
VSNEKSNFVLERMASNQTLISSMGVVCDLRRWVVFARTAASRRACARRWFGYQEIFALASVSVRGGMAWVLGGVIERRGFELGIELEACGGDFISSVDSYARK